MVVNNIHKFSIGGKRIFQFSINCVVVICVLIFLSSCSSSFPEPKYNKPSAKKNIVTAKQFFPTGWANITSKSKRPDIQYWLVNREYSATMVLREIQTDSSTQKILRNGELSNVANISLLSKIPENNTDFRVTRVPTNIDAKRNFFSYAFSEKGLLRRVIIFKKQRQLYELELIQEQASSEFEELTNDLLMFAVTLYEG